MAREKPQLPVNYAEQLAKEAAEIAKRLAAPSGDRIRTDGPRGFITPDGQEGESIEAVIVNFVSSNAYYEGIYDAGNPQPPACFAIGTEPATMVPSDNSPNKQADACAICSNNQFGTALNGKGKACKNTRQLALVSVDALDNPDVDPPIWVLAVPPASIKSFDTYARTLATQHKTVPSGVITQITLEQGTQYAAPRFSVLRPLNPEEMGVYWARKEEATQRLFAEPDVSNYIPPKNQRVRR